MTVAVRPIAAPWRRFHLYSFLIDAPELAIVDTGVTASAAGVPGELAKLGRRIEDVRWILLTHGHIDHIGGAYALWEATGRRAEVVVSEADAPFVRSRRAHVDEALALRGDRVGREALEAKKTAEALEAISGEFEPTRLIGDGDVLDLGGAEVRVHAIPGHTPGAVAYEIAGQGDVFVGDAVQSYGAASGFPGYEDADLYRDSLRRLQALEPQRMYLGHPYRRKDGTPFPVVLDAADAAEAIRGSLDREAEIRAAVARAGEGTPSDSPYSPYQQVAEELGYTGDPTLEPAPFFTSIHAYRSR
ncbi:MBL fold metallo-hydrolase [Microbacterium sp. NPDC096154]|uniref:MBL fold metallo-hydrolase n=1 Tax=Microbacterium sp. NPDC096154 TaxID=3155549 RepID=UPI00332A9500